MNSVKLKKTAINKIPFPESQRKQFRIEGFKYLLLRVTPNNKIFNYYRKINGKPVKKKIGEFNEHSLTFVEKRYYEINNAVANGESISKSSSMTLEELFQEFIKSTDKKTKNIDIQSFYRHFSSIKNIQIDNITFHHIKKLHKNLKDRPSQANRCLALLSVVFNFGIKEMRLNITNPCFGIKKYKEHPKTRILSKSEMERFFKTIEQWKTSNKFYADLFLTLFLTGQRKSNVFKMKYENINFETREWYIPHTETKNRENQTVILVEDVLEIIKERQQNVGGKYVFPSPADPSTYIKDIRRAWKKFLKAAEISNLNVHDLRRSYGAYLLMSCNNMKTVQEMLGHKDIKTTSEVYTPIINEHKKKAVDDMVEGLKKDN